MYRSALPLIIALAAPCAADEDRDAVARCLAELDRIQAVIADTQRRHDIVRGDDPQRTLYSTSKTLAYWRQRLKKRSEECLYLMDVRDKLVPPGAVP